mmetsp:Transcript_48019/g.126806  ORF Transcript_48019/g.126806 Transcript_48019/m.126806 type:complete len:728 (-) Transcript_48019:9-2192(-)
MAYNFATAGYHGAMKATPGIDVEALRAEALKRIDAFSPKLWYDEPVETLLRGEPLRADGDQSVETVDAFGKVNGRQVVAVAASVDKVIAHVRSYKAPQADNREACRAVEDLFFGNTPLAADLVANQALDFHKQDGLTEIEESVQALRVERQLNDALFEDEKAGKVSIGRQPAFVGCVSNFTNFLDLCRKILRNMELGVPVVVLSRSNTTQHMFRYMVPLLGLLRERGVDLGLCTYLSCSIEEQRRVLQAAAGSPMYFTGSREVASKIKEVMPRLMASTGGPNTMVVGPGLFTPEVAEAARMSSLIEHKGQCTAMRHLVLPKATDEDIRRVYSSFSSSTAAESLRGKQFSSLLKPLRTPLAAGYAPLPGQDAARPLVALRTQDRPPAAIDEMWREAYLDVTAPPELSAPFMAELAAWLNREQPISLALNCEMAAARQLFENTALVVYTVGSPSSGSPALTCQARPQDGECFGEFPARRDLEAVTSFPVIIPSSTPGYNSGYPAEFLARHGKEPLEAWGLPKELAQVKTLLRRIKAPEAKGFARLLMEYLLDAAGEANPRRGCGQRTSLFGLQRPPLAGGTCCLRLEKPEGVSNAPHAGDGLFDEAAAYILPFLATNAKEQLVLSLDPFLAFPAFPMLSQQGLKVVRESREAFAASEAGYWNVITLPRAPAARAATPDHPLAAHFISRILPMGHVKSTLPDHQGFLDAFAASPKWLRVGAQAGAPGSRL